MIQSAGRASEAVERSWGGRREKMKINSLCVIGYRTLWGRCCTLSFGEENKEKHNIITVKI